MDEIKVSGGRFLRGRLRPPGDETLSHAALLLGAMAEGHSLFEWLSPSLAVRSTWNCLEELGATITASPRGEQTAIRGLGWRGLIQTRHDLDAGDSAGTARLLMGVIAANPIAEDIFGGEGLERVPLSDVAAPLRAMGASITLRGAGKFAPVGVMGAALKGIRHAMPQPCGQTKAALLLAATMAIGETSVTEPFPADVRLERMLNCFGAKVRREGLTTSVTGGVNLAGTRLAVPPDLSWAGFWALAGGLLPGSEVFIEGLAPQDDRIGAFGALAAMGLRPDWHVDGLRVRHLRLSGADIPRELACADIPLLALAASHARGTTRLRGALGPQGDGPDRASRLISLLKGLGVPAGAEGEDMVISGPAPLKPGRIFAGEDERIARAGCLAGLLTEGETTVSQAGVLYDRYPGLLKTLGRLR